MAKERLPQFNNMSPEFGPGTWALANISPWVCNGTQTQFEAPGSLSDPSLMADIPVSTPETPYTPVQREIARFLAERNDPNFGAPNDRGLRVWFFDWDGKAKGIPCEINEKVMESVRAIAESREKPADLQVRISQRNAHKSIDVQGLRGVSATIIPDDGTTPEQLAAIVKANRLGHLIGPETPHRDRVKIVQGALRDRYMTQRQVASEADIARVASEAPKAPPKQAAAKS